MHWAWYVLIAVLAALLIVLLTAFICFMKVFYSPRKWKFGEGEIYIPNNNIYNAHRDTILEWVKMIRTMPRRELTVTSHDGLTLVGYYFEYTPGAPIEILFHGYRGNAERDLSGGIERCFALGRNALIVDQRAAGASGGKVTTFGILESRDCLCWVNRVIEEFGENTQIILAGVSMGAATVMIAAGEKLPPCVVQVLADCGYTSAREIIKKVIREMHLPAGLLYPFVKLGARLFGRFNLDEKSPIAAVSRAEVPIIFIHGDNDDFVPCEMSERLYEACASKKKLTLIKGAGHGLAFPADKDSYIGALADFAKEIGI